MRMGRKAEQNKQERTGVEVNEEKKNEAQVVYLFVARGSEPGLRRVPILGFMYRRLLFVD